MQSVQYYHAPGACAYKAELGGGGGGGVLLTEGGGGGGQDPSYTVPLVAGFGFIVNPWFYF